jgi:undecaprenol kinase
MGMKNKSFLYRLGFALEGLKAAWLIERSFRTQVVIACLVLLAMIFLRPDYIWWALVLIVIALVLGAELFNTALENLSDHLHPEIHEKIKLVKDVAAAAVLVFSLMAALVGCLLVLSIVL